jgi:hypothetical protein
MHQALCGHSVFVTRISRHRGSTGKTCCKADDRALLEQEVREGVKESDPHGFADGESSLESEHERTSDIELVREIYELRRLLESV